MRVTENLDAFLQDFGVSVVLGSVSGLGVLDMPDQVVGGGLVQSTDYSLICKTADFGGATLGDAILVDGLAYEVRDVNKIDDGRFCRLSLSRR